MNVQNKCYVYMQIPVQIKIVCWMNKQWVVCVVSNYCVRPRAPCFEIFPVSFGFPEFYSTASLDVLVKICLVVTKLSFIQVCISENQNEYSKLKSRMSKIANMMYFWLSLFLDVIFTPEELVTRVTGTRGKGRLDARNQKSHFLFRTRSFVTVSCNANYKIKSS